MGLSLRLKTLPTPAACRPAAELPLGWAPGVWEDPCSLPGKPLGGGGAVIGRRVMGASAAGAVSIDAATEVIAISSSAASLGLQYSNCRATYDLVELVLEKE